MPIDLSYPKIVDNFGRHNIPGRTESRAFLGWFLENYYRLEEADAQDAICDGFDDKGIDGVYVDDNLEKITVFQTKLIQNDKKTLGDVALKEFAGSIDQFKSKEKVDRVAATTTNAELAGILKERNVADLVDKGYEVAGVFVTNVDRDANADKYLQHRSDIRVFDRSVLQSEWISPGDNAPVKGRLQFSLDGHSVIEYKTLEATVFIAPLLASELVTLDGIQSTELFDWNVRKSLGKTKVNKAIAESISNQSEHKNFVLYHNGLTILAEKAEQSDDSLTVDGYTVVNGCQSLTTLYQNRAKLSNELRVIARVIKLPPQSALAAKITRHSNNQNSISARDLQANSNIQRRLQSEFASKFKDKFYYEIKRGEVSGSEIVITNEEAARMLLAFDLQQPWACHQSYRLFDELHSDIFGRPEVNATRIVILYIMHQVIIELMPNLKNQLAANYRLMQYFLLYLLRKALDVDENGKRFVAEPEQIITLIDWDGFAKVVKNVLGDLIIDLNAELEERDEKKEYFDFKRELKSPVAIRKLGTEVVAMYQKGVRRSKSASFSGEVEALIAAEKGSGAIFG
jgi:hypothetical protein